MKTKKSKIMLTLLMVSLFVLFSLNLFGCAGATPIKDKPGAQLWGENCAHCHTIRPPQALTDAQWDIVGMHMRTRANLTAVEARKIVEFLKQSN